jgi:tetratricopeptide (TPR) repeat protein
VQGKENQMSRFFKRPRVFYRTVLLAFGLFWPVILSAQMVSSSSNIGGTGGNHEIQGRVLGPDGARLNASLRVTLESTNAATISTSTNAEGVFNFRNLEPGEYRLTIQGEGNFETTSEPISIYREASPGRRIITRVIYLRPKNNASGRAGVVNAALAEAPKPAADLYLKAMDAVRAGDAAKAIEHLQAALAIHPKFALALSELGVQHLKLGQPDKAAAALEAALQLTPDDFSSRLNYGIALYGLNKLPDAEKHLRQALKQNDAVATGHLYLGMALARQRKLDEGEQELQRAIKLGNDEPSVARAHYFLGGIYMAKNDSKRAANELDAFLKLVPNAPDAERIRKTIADLRAKG